MPAILKAYRAMILLEKKRKSHEAAASEMRNGSSL